MTTHPLSIFVQLQPLSNYDTISFVDIRSAYTYFCPVHLQPHIYRQYPISLYSCQSLTAHPSSISDKPILLSISPHIHGRYQISLYSCQYLTAHPSSIIDQPILLSISDRLSIANNRLISIPVHLCPSIHCRYPIGLIFSLSLTAFLSSIYVQLKLLSTSKCISIFET